MMYKQAQFRSQQHTQIQLRAIKDRLFCTLRLASSLFWSFRGVNKERLFSVKREGMWNGPYGMYGLF